MNILKAAAGHYETHGDIADADVIVGHSFGTSTHPESPNGALARFIMRNEDGQPIVVDQTLARAFPKSTLLDVAVGGAVSDAMGSIGGSWETIMQAKQYMDKEELRRPAMAAHAFHIGRVAMQAEKIGMKDVIIPSGLPSIFDRQSAQIWTRAAGLWVPREVLGSFVLRHQGKL